MSQLPWGLCKANDSEQARESKKNLKLHQTGKKLSFSPVAQLVPKGSPKSGSAQWVQRRSSKKNPSFWVQGSRKRKINDKGRNSVLCLPLPLPLPRGNTAGGCCKAMAVPPGRHLKLEKGNSSRPEELRPCEHAVISPYPLTAWCEFTKKNTTIPIANILNNSVKKYMRQKLTDTKGKINNSSIIVKRLHHVLQG